MKQYILFKSFANPKLTFPIITDAVHIENKGHSFSISASKEGATTQLNIFMMDNVFSNFYHGKPGVDGWIKIDFKKDYFKIAKVVFVSRFYGSNPVLYGCSYKKEE